MDFWKNKINVSKKAAKKQVEIINSFSADKKIKIALDFANLGVDRTRQWIKESNPNYSDLEITLEFVKLIYYDTGQMKEDKWRHFKKIMEEKIKKNWADRFRKMMKDNNWNYNDVAKLGGFKNGKVIEATISRGLPSFAKLSVMIYELKNKEKGL